MHFITLASVAFSAAAGVSAIVIPRAHVHHARTDTVSADAAQPSTYYTPYLEPYDVYHARYMALDCEGQHNTTFFDSCCHPMLSTETLEANRAPECNPANLASSTASSSAAPTSTQDLSTSGDDGDDSDCDDDDDETTTSAAPSTTPVATSSTHSVTPTTTKAPTTTHTSTTPTSTKASTTKASTTKASTTKASTTKTSTTAKATSTSSVETGGVATFFYQGGNAGACGTVHADSALIAAIDADRYGDLGAVSALCGKQVLITNTNNGKTVTVTIADACPTCENSNSIDLSVGAFTEIATEEEGEVPISWVFV